MAVRPDQLALLQLLVERGQSYADVAGVLDTDPAQARTMAHDALGDLAGEPPDPHLADYLLGQATPLERADVARRLRADDQLAAEATDLSAELTRIAPNAQVPALPDEAHAPDRAPGGREVEPQRSSLSSRQRWLMLGLAALAVAIVAVVLVATGAFDGDQQAEQQAAQPTDDLDAVSVDLAPQGESDATGSVLLGLATGDQPFLDLSVKRLEPIEAGDAYIVWLMVSPDRGWPLSPIDPDKNGDFSDRFPVPSFLLQSNVVKRLQSIVVSRSPRAELLRAADNAAEEGVPEVDLVGDVVLSGEVPEAGAPAQR